MNVSREWLEAFLRRTLDARDAAARLAMLGAPVDGVEPLHPGLSDIVIGLVEEVAPHPNADRLRLCTVNDGSPERRTVVCGAPNVNVGARYPFAPLGAALPGGLVIEKRKIRGIASEGMLCSARELGLGDDQGGLLEVEVEAPPGTRLLDALPLGDERLVVDVTPNRPDLLGHKGIARELAASYRVPFRLPEIPGFAAPEIPAPRREGAAAEVGGIRIALEDVEGCLRFHAAVLRGVRVGPSPAWLRRRLEAVGVRAINNVVDATNYVMFELNQPMHAYDARLLTGHGLVVRQARAGEALVTLDGVSRTMEAGMTVITDGSGVIGLAGIMGGATTEVSNDTTDVLLEAACWEPSRLRRTRRAVGISTEASYRFERGIDLWGGAEAMRRCIELVLATAGGRLAEPPVDIWPDPGHPPRIFLRPARVTQVLGVELSWGQIEQALTSVGATVLAKPDDARIAVDVPGWRPDLQVEIDLIEEVARMHGYENIPIDLRGARPGRLRDAPIELAARRVRRGLVGWGLFEAMSLPMGAEDGSGSVRLLNPLASTDPHLRRRILPGLVRQVERNWSAQVRDVRLFEIGTVFERGPAGQLPTERRHVGIAVTGGREPAHWSSSGQVADVDVWDLRSLFEAAVGLAFPSAAVQVDSDHWIAMAPDGRVVGSARRMEADAPPWAAPLFGIEVELDATERAAPTFAGLPSTPAATRDLALVLRGGLTAQSVSDAISAAAGPALEAVSVIDEYRGPNLPAGSRSVAFRLVFRAADRTLRDSEVDDAVRVTVAALENDLGVHLRAS